jgi:hypothetical protein
MSKYCTAISCIRQLPKNIKRVSANYEIEETCRNAKNGECQYTSIKRNIPDAGKNKLP